MLRQVRLELWPISRFSWADRATEWLWNENLTKVTRSITTGPTTKRLRLNKAVSASAKLETNTIIRIHEHTGRGAMLLLTQSLIQPFQKCFHSPLISPSLRCGLWSRRKIHATDKQVKETSFETCSDCPTLQRRWWRPCQVYVLSSEGFTQSKEHPWRFVAERCACPPCLHNCEIQTVSMSQFPTQQEPFVVWPPNQKSRNSVWPAISLQVWAESQITGCNAALWRSFSGPNKPACD